MVATAAAADSYHVTCLCRGQPGRRQPRRPGQAEGGAWRPGRGPRPRPGPGCGCSSSSPGAWGPGRLGARGMGQMGHPSPIGCCLIGPQQGGGRRRGASQCGCGAQGWRCVASGCCPAERRGPPAPAADTCMHGAHAPRAQGAPAVAEAGPAGAAGAAGAPQGGAVPVDAHGEQGLGQGSAEEGECGWQGS
jgi:hypothetical protein